MSLNHRILLLFVMPFACISGVAKASEGSATFVLSIGEDQSFEPSLKKLRYAALDSKRFARAMEIVSEVPDDQIHITNNIAISEFRSLAATVVQKLRMHRNVKRFVFYFSGHSDERGLHFKDGLYPKDELHALLKKIPTQTKISILDSCYSGALAAKGIEPAVSEFTIPKSDFDEPTGTVFLTASSADEGAFESTRFESSVFSNYLVAGLYGSADSNGDGLVTVDELYQYIYQKTRYDNLMLPQAVQQQPEFVSKLQGRGALVLSMPKANLQSLQIDPRIKGDIHVQATYGLRSYLISGDQRGTNLVRLPAGEYLFSVQNGTMIGRTSFKLQAHRVAVVSANDIEWTRMSSDEQAKGPTPTAPVTEQSGAILVSQSTKLPPPVIETHESQTRMSSSSEVDASLTARPDETRIAPQIMLGAHSGYFKHESAGPAFSIMAVERHAVSIGTIGVEPVAGLFAHQNSDYTTEAQGASSSIAIIAGSRVLFGAVGPGLEPYAQLFAGVSQVSQQWKSDESSKEFHQAFIPVMHLGAGIEREFKRSGLRVGVDYRRELARVQDRDYGSAAVGADIYSLSVLY